jgi:hypothetical protein
MIIRFPIERCRPPAKALPKAVGDAYRRDRTKKLAAAIRAQGDTA